MTETIGSVPRCATCGSERIVRDAWACWNPSSGLWELEAVRSLTYCRVCDDPAALTWQRDQQIVQARIRELNDQFRTTGVGNGSLLITQGIQAEGSTFIDAALKAVRSFNAFSEDNDPWGEHDFGSMDIDDKRIYFKFDYYAPNLAQGSENPANEGLTHRVLTIMLSSEY